MPPLQDENDLQIARLAIEKGYCSEAQIEEARDIVSKLAGMGMAEDLASVLVKKKYLAEHHLEELRRSTTTRQPVNIGGFEIIGRLGRGAMGAVYKARQVSMDRVVALKVLPPSLARDQNYVGRFFHEARAVAQLNHPNIIQGIDVGVSGKYYYFAMEFVDGKTVRDLLRERGRFDERGALGIVEQAAAALDHAHRNGLIHRDIKPENIMITSDGVAKLCDLGLAKTRGSGATLTQSGLAVGTPHYISPEQARGESDVDIRADLYSLGATLFHMLSGKTPYSGTTAAVVMTKHLSEGVPDVRRIRPDVSEPVTAILRKLMAKERVDRYQTPDELLEDLRRLREGHSLVHASAPRARAPRPTVRRAPARRSVRHGGAAAAAPSHRALVLAAVIAGAGLAAIGAGVLAVALLGSGENGEALPAPAPRDRPPDVAPGPGPGPSPGPEAHPRVSPKAAAAADLLARARAYEKKHPGSYRAIWLGYREAHDKYPNTPAAAEAGRDMKRVEAAHRDAALKAVDGLDTRAEELRKRDRFAEAIKVYNGIPAELMRKEAMDRIHAARNRLRSGGEARWREVKRETEALVPQGRYDEAAKRAAEAADRIGLASVTVEKQGFLDRLKGMERDRLASLRSAAEKRADAAWVALRDAAFAAAHEEERLRPEAARCRRTLDRDKNLAPHKALVEGLAADLERAAAVYDDARAYCRRAAGRGGRVTFVDRKGIVFRGVVVGYDAGNDRVSFEVTAGITQGLVVGEDLSTASLARLAPGAGLEKPGEAYAYGLVAFFRGEDAEAHKAFTLAAKGAAEKPRAERYLAILAPRIKAAREKEAAELIGQSRALYGRIKLGGDKADWERLKALLDRIEEYKDTEAYKKAR